GRDSLDGLGEEVFVGHWHDRHGDPGEAADFGRKHAAGVHDDVRADDCALAGVLDLYAGDPPALDADVDDAAVGPDGDPAATGTRRQGLGEAGRVQPAVGRQEDRAEHALGRHQGEALLGL